MDVILEIKLKQFNFVTLSNLLKIHSIVDFIF